MLLAMGLGACHRGAPPAPPPPGTAIACALDGGDWAQECRMERLATGAGGASLVVLHRPDGGFHRLRLGRDGTLALADGAGTLALDSPTDLRVGADLFRLPLERLKLAP
ncbi:MAG TPA: hypothetical protein VFF98_06900 [Novosphingobium sp.]|nr:hypothetical protein [Novosphingobium sp.]